MRSTPRHSRSSIATLVGTLLLSAVCPSAVGAAGAEVATESEALPPLVQGQVLVQRETLTLATAGMHWQTEGGGTDAPMLIDTGHAEEAAAGGEGISGTGGSFPDNTYGFGGFVSPSPASLSLEGRVSRIEGYLPHLATKADLRATEGLLRAELQEGLRTQLLHFLWVMGGMLTVLGTILILVMRFALLPAIRDAVVIEVMQRLEERLGDGGGSASSRRYTAASA